MFFYPSGKMAISFADITGITARTSKFDLRNLEIESLVENIEPILKGVKMSLILIFSFQNLPIILLIFCCVNDETLPINGSLKTTKRQRKLVSLGITE